MGKTGATNSATKPKKDGDLSFYDKNGNQLWLVEQILEKKVQGGKAYYLVKWQGYGKEEATWEPLENVMYVKDMVDSYEEKLKKDKEKDKKKTRESTSNLQRASRKISKADKPVKAPQSETLKKSKSLKSDDVGDQSEHGGWAHDIAFEITDHAILEENESTIRSLSGKAALGRVLFKVEWKKRKDGTQPLSSYYKYSTLKKKCPYLLLDYVENMVHFD